MIEAVRQFFLGGMFMPHGHCYFWDRGLILLHVISDVLIFTSYTAIPITLIYIVHRRKETPFRWMFFCFGTFIVACGLTHLMEIWNLWHSAYWLSGLVKAVTATASLATAWLLVRLVPPAVALPGLRELLRINEHLADNHREVQRLNLHLEDKAAELAAANKELESFCYSVSHDLRAPLRSIDGFSRAVLEDEGPRLTDDARADLERVRTATQRMGELIDDMLSLSRVTRQELIREEVDLSALAREVLQDLRRAEPGRVVKADVQEGLRVRGDRVLLRAVLDNLVGNAWKFSSKKDGARIEVGAREDPAEGRVFFVKDNGAGFDMAYKEKLFNTFQRLHAATEFPGNGVGLATVKRIVSRHGGRVWAESRPGEGATFSFTLPASVT